MARQWTEEERKKQAEAIRRWKPWKNSTGPKTAEGKARTRLNAFSHGAYMPHWQVLRAGLRAQKLFVENALIWTLAEAEMERLKAQKIKGTNYKESVELP